MPAGLATWLVNFGGGVISEGRTGFGAVALGALGAAICRPLVPRSGADDPAKLR